MPLTPRPTPRLGALVGLACLLTAAPGPALAGGPTAPAHGAAAADLSRASAPDARVTPSGRTARADAAAASSPLSQVTTAVRAGQARSAGITGRGVDVAVLDSGVAPVDGLDAPGKVVRGADLSFGTGDPALRHLDGYGHGTHLASIIAGDEQAGSAPGAGGHRYTGIAPDARIVSVRAADATGATDVSHVVAGLDWLVQHGRDGDLDVRVVNLSFGTDRVQDHRDDRLAQAVERAWHAGVVVVVSAGNAGQGPAGLDSPAYDPYVLAVGGSDTRGTATTEDDVVAPWSSRGDAARHPDLVAPGASVPGLRSPGSSLDAEHPARRSGTRFLRGSGSSQAAAVVSGAAALLLQQRPGLTPDEVKALLVRTARPLAHAHAAAQGAGLLDVGAALDAPTPTDAVQTWPRAQAGGPSWTGGTWTGGTWTGGTWTGNTWTGNTWTGSTWTGNTWTGNTWTGNTWTGGTWTGNTWTGNTWTGNTWTGNTWTGNTWTGNTWTGNTWTADGQ